MTVAKGKRPHDPNQLGKWVVEHSTAEPAPVVPLPAPESLSAYMSAIGRKGGAIGGKRRLLTMTQEKRREVAQKAAGVRWAKKKKA
jgi:hypothetical protein